VRKGPRPFSFLVAILAVCMFAAVGFRVGQSQRSSKTDAASTWQTAAAAAYSPARATAYRSAWHHGYARGWAAGAVHGKSAGSRAGSTAGSAEAAVGTSAARAVAAVLAATPVKLEHGVRTERCIEVAGGLCETLGPRITGRSCPSGSVADPEGGVVCVPQVLLEAARMAGAPGAGIFTP
jgi:hypothetical protein